MQHAKQFRNKPGARLAAAVITLGILAIICAGCQRQTETKSEVVPQKDINAVMQAHTAELMAIPGVVGVAIGETDDKKPCILVLVKEETEDVKKAIPAQLEGYPTRLLVAGEIKPMEGK